MKLLSYGRRAGDPPRLGLLRGEQVVDVRAGAIRLGMAGGLGDEGAPATLQAALEQWERCEPFLRELLEKSTELEPGGGDPPVLLEQSEILFHPPVGAPRTFRDFYAFEQHVKTARANRGLEMVPQWYDFPVFYFSNPTTLLGHRQALRAPSGCEWLDYELEVGAVLGRSGRDLDPGRAEEHIAGYLVLNDWSARDLQRQEMKVGLGPAKGKDFATSCGPYLVTPDELADRRAGRAYDLAMVARRGGAELSRGNFKEIHYSFGEMLARASRDVTLLPGDLIGSGTVGTGCILELGPERAGGWLRPGDLIELEIERLGILSTEIEA